MKKQKSIGETHNKDVCQALKNRLEGQAIANFVKPVQLTVESIIKKFSNIKRVKGKYDCPKPDDEPSIKLTLITGEEVVVNLFSFQTKGKFQPKNLGVKSFMEKYFQAVETQQKFNEFVEGAYLKFLSSIVETKKELGLYGNKKDDLSRLVKEVYPSFTEEINPIRTSFLFQLREKLFELLLQENAIPTSGLEMGVKELLLADSFTLITYYNEKNELKMVEEWRPELDLSEKVQLYKKGNETVGIRIGQLGLTLRLKFESSPTSSLKMATSFDRFPIENERQQINKKSLLKFNKLLTNSSIYNVTKNDPNATGKCNEALVYAGFVEKYNTVYQTDNEEHIKMLEAYAPSIKEQTMDYLRASVNTTIEEMESYLTKKHKAYELESIQLVPQSYVKDRLNTADIQLTLKVRGLPRTEEFSLKALSKPGGRVTMKNPGIGTILSTQYFGIGTMEDVVKQVKLQYEANELTHEESLHEVSKQLGLKLQSATQIQLQKGLSALFGAAPTVITFYKTKQCVIKEHEHIISEVIVYSQAPTPINTTLIWAGGTDEIRLRVKFSAGQRHGWSSLKLACEYGVK